MKTRVLIVLALGLFLGQCSGDGALIQPLADGITNDGSLSETPDGDVDNSGTITGNPTGEPGNTDSDTVPSSNPTLPVEDSTTDTTDTTDTNDENPQDDSGADLTDPVEDEADAPGYVEGDSDLEDTNTDVVPEVPTEADQDAPGYVEVEPNPEDYNNDVVPVTPEDSMSLDNDGDGLANAIDPRPNLVDTWGFIDADNMSVSIFEASGYVYRYIGGSKSPFMVQEQVDRSVLVSDKVAPPSGPAIQVLPVPQTNSYGIVVNNGISVTGLLDRNQARLPTVNSIAGNSGLAHEFEYGIYVKYRNITFQRR